MSDEGSLVPEQRAIVFANDGDVVANVVSVQVAEHQNQRLEHRGRGFWVLLIHEGEQQGQKLVVVLDELASRREWRETAKPHVPRENGHQLQDRVSRQGVRNGEMVHDNVDDRREIMQQHLRTLHLVENLMIDRARTSIPR